MGEEYDDYLGEDNELPEPFEWLNLIPKPPIGEETVFTACARGDLAALRGLVELNGESIDDHDSFNAVPLYYACLCGHYKVVDYLLCRGARCQVDTFDTTRCLYAALTDDIRRLTFFSSFFITLIFTGCTHGVLTISSPNIPLPI